MRRLVLVLAMALVMAGMIAVNASVAFAVANPQASCSGEAQSSAERGDVGRAHRSLATQSPAGTLGEIHSSTNQDDNCFDGTSAPGSGPPGKPDLNQGPN
jgi:hypothetical protein